MNKISESTARPHGGEQEHSTPPSHITQKSKQLSASIEELAWRLPLAAQAASRLQRPLTPERENERSIALAEILSLIAAGANPSVPGPTGVYNCPASAVDISACEGDLQALEILLQSPLLEINARDQNEDTPLILTAANGQASCLRALLSFGADPNAGDAQGVNGLMWAIYCRSYASCLVLAPLTDLTATTHAGKTVWDIAEEHGKEIALDAKALFSALAEARILANQSAPSPVVFCQKASRI